LTIFLSFFSLKLYIPHVSSLLTPWWLKKVMKKIFLAFNKRKKFSPLTLMTTFTSNWRRLWWHIEKKMSWTRHGKFQLHMKSETFFSLVLRTCYTFFSFSLRKKGKISFQEFEQQTFSTLMTKVFLFTTEIRYGMHEFEWKKFFFLFLLLCCLLTHVCCTCECDRNKISIMDGRNLLSISKCRA
jgi:hypothetical protein